MIDCVAMDASAFRHQLLDFRSHAAQEAGRGFARAMARLARKDSPQIIIQISRPFEGVFLALAIVVLPQRDANFRKGFNLSPHPISRPRAGDLVQEFVNVFEFAQGGPATITAPPVRAWL